MYLGRVLNSPRVKQCIDFVDNRLEHVFCLHYLHHNGIMTGSDKKMLSVKLRCFHLTGGKCINGRKLEPFGEVFAGPPGQLSR